MSQYLSLKPKIKFSFSQLAGLADKLGLSDVCNLTPADIAVEVPFLSHLLFFAKFD